MYKIRKSYSVFILIAVVLLFGTVVSAQQTFPAYERTFSIIINPKNPGPHQDIDITVYHYASDISRSNILWYINGTLVERGIGLTKISTKTGAAGSVLTIRVVIETKEGDTISKSISLAPAEVDLLWEADTYTPPFYTGKSLPTRDSTIRIVAVPTFVTSWGARINSSELFYKWNIGGEVIDVKSGKGNSSISIKPSILSSITSASVEVTDYNRNLIAKKSISITTEDPEIVIYEEDPLMGTQYERSIEDGFSFLSSEVSLKSEPYYFSVEDIADGLSYKWELNGRDITKTDNSNIFTFLSGNAFGGESGMNFNLSVIVRNLNKVMQRAVKEISLKF